MIARISGFRYLFIRCLAAAVLVTAVSASAAVVDVSVVNNRFQPASVNIQVNDEVRWTWAPADGGVPHTTTSETPGLWDSGIHTQPFNFTVPFLTAGSFPYVCTLHASIGMVGTVTVQGTSSLPPTITTQPANRTVNVGDNVTFNVVATGSAPLSYQWKKNTTNIPGANAASLTLNAVTVADAGSYTVTVTNSAGSVTSDAAVLTVNAGGAAPVITTQPASQTVVAGQPVTFNVVATGTPPLSYQWKKGAANLPGANAASLTLNAVTTADAGSYTVVVTNTAGSVTSDARGTHSERRWRRPGYYYPARQSNGRPRTTGNLHRGCNRHRPLELSVEKEYCEYSWS
jgi:plastocyanin